MLLRDQESLRPWTPWTPPTTSPPTHPRHHSEPDLAIVGLGLVYLGSLLSTVVAMIRVVGQLSKGAAVSRSEGSLDKGDRISTAAARGGASRSATHRRCRPVSRGTEEFAKFLSRMWLDGKETCLAEKYDRLYLTLFTRSRFVDHFRSIRMTTFSLLSYVCRWWQVTCALRCSC